MLRRMLFTLFCVGLLSTATFAQTSGSGLTVFETFSSGLGPNATQASVLAGEMTTQTVLFAAVSALLSSNTAIAIVNPNGVAANLTMVLRNGADGTTSAVQTLTIGADQQVAEFISELFDGLPALGTDFSGSLFVSSDIPVAITALRFRGTIFSILPTMSLSLPILVPQITADVGGPAAVILPQLATGGGWSSQIVISNSTAAAVTVRIDLFKQDGTPLTTNFNDELGSTFQNVMIPANGVVIENNDGTGTLQVGYAVITPVNLPAPEVTLTVPANASSAVPINQEVTAAFSEPMDPSTINTTTFTLTQGTMPISGSVTYAGITATFIPTAALLPNTAYSATITTGVKEVVADIPLANNFVWSFTTGTTPDTTPPTVNFTVPSAAATAVPINQAITATFSKALDPTTINGSTFTLKSGSTPIWGMVSYIGVTAIFTPPGNLTPGATYTAMITTGAKCAAGYPMAANYVWTFTTAAVLDTTPPAIASVNPANLATGVALSVTPSATFSEAINPSTMTTATFRLKGSGGTPVTGTVTYNVLTNTATFTPLAFLPSDTYTATITTGMTDLAGNALASNFVWSFSLPGTVTSNGPATQINAGGLPTPVIEEFSTVWDIGNPLLGLMFYVQPTSSFHRVARSATTDAGLTWTPGVDIGLTQVTPASAEERNPVVRDFAANGSLIGFFGTKQGTYPGGFGPNDVLFRAFSGDTGVSWGGESQLAFNVGAFPGNTGMNGLADVFMTSSGVLRGYAAMNNFAGTPRSTTHRVESSDGGATWLDLGSIQIPGPGGVFNIPSASGPIFHFTDTSDNQVKLGWFCFGEGPNPPNRGIQLVISTDEGLSWTAGSFGFIDTTIESGNAHFLSDSQVRLFYHRDTTDAPDSLWYEDFTITGMKNIQPDNLFLAPTNTSPVKAN